MKRGLLSIVLFFILAGCRTFHYLSSDLEGTYTQNTDNGYKLDQVLTLTKDRFSLVEDASHSEYSPYDCCDTVTYGKWKIDNSHGILSLSNDEFLSSAVWINVKEETSSNKDSLFFYISNPIEAKMNYEHKDIEYIINLYTDKELLHEYLDNKYFDTNEIIIRNSGHAKIKSFSIDIYPKPSYNGRNVPLRVINSVEYKVLSDGNPNVFRIDIPKLTYPFITYLRLKNDYVKIVNKDKLEWGGYIYKIKKQ